MNEDDFFEKFKRKKIKNKFSINPPEIFFQILFDGGNHSYLKVLDSYHVEIEIFNYRLFTGRLRDILKTLHNIQFHFSP